VSEIVTGLATLAALDRAALGERWEVVFGVPAPRGYQAALLRQALAWDLQVQALGRSGVRRSRKAIRSLSEAPGSATPAPGTRLMREWRG
jgi:hypothetical protein